LPYSPPDRAGDDTGGDGAPGCRGRREIDAEVRNGGAQYRVKRDPLNCELMRVNATGI
jgi:hypothetical protein